ncbi:pantothenate kinase [Colletotrichum tofieldiae]|nr:pantothenate kinase [Colletotrichum tofieldiae]
MNCTVPSHLRLAVRAPDDHPIKTEHGPAPDDGGSAVEDPQPDDELNNNTNTTSSEPAVLAGADIRTRARTMTSTEEIDNTIIRPGSVRINVKGAFIVDPDSSSPSNNGRGSPTHHETSDIRLPNHHAVVSHIAVDIGGSLIKLVYFTREPHSAEPGGRLNFLNFETDRIDDCIEFMRHLKDKQQTLNGSQPNELSVMATGGGAFKFYDKMRDVLGVDVLREEEMECLIIGLDFFITEIPREVFTYSETDPMHFVSPSENIYPYLLVNIGSGSRSSRFRVPANTSVWAEPRSEVARYGVSCHSSPALGPLTRCSTCLNGG